MSDKRISTLGFWANYAHLCIRKKICPLRCILKHLNGPILTCPVEYIREAHCSCVNAAMAIDNSLTAVHFYSDIYLRDKTLSQNFYLGRYQNKRYFPLPYSLTEENLLNMCGSLGSCLKTTHRLTELKLENLPLSFHHVKLLAVGLNATTSLKVLSMSGCPLGDEAVEFLVRNLKYVFSVQWLNFSSCKIAVRSVEAIAQVLTFQSDLRRNETWPRSLRDRKPDLDNFSGLDRISLNDNSGFDDESIKLLLDPLIDDFWLKALDLQKCSITTRGAIDLLTVLTENCIMQILDLRLNCGIDISVLEEIAEQLAANNAGKTLKYELLPLVSKLPLKKKMFRKRVAKPTSIKIKIAPRIPYSRGAKSRKKDNFGRSFVVKSSEPHTEEELRGALGEVKDFDEQLTGDTEASVKALGKEIDDLKRSLYAERETKTALLAKLQQVEMENELLKEQLQNRQAPEGFVLIDNETCNHIKETFQKFLNFLALLNENGLKNSALSPVREHIVHLQASNSEFGTYQSFHNLPQTGLFSSQSRLPVGKSDPSLRPRRPVDDLHSEHQKFQAASSDKSQACHEEHKPIPAKLLSLQDKVHLVKLADGFSSYSESSHSSHKQELSALENMQGRVPILKLREPVPSTTVQNNDFKSAANIPNTQKSKNPSSAASSSSESSKVVSLDPVHKLSGDIVNSNVSSSSVTSAVIPKNHTHSYQCGAGAKSMDSKAKTMSEGSICNSCAIAGKPKKYCESVPSSFGASDHAISSYKNIKKSRSEIISGIESKKSVESQDVDYRRFPSSGSHSDIDNSVSSVKSAESANPRSSSSRSTDTLDVDRHDVSQVVTSPEAADNSSKSSSSSNAAPLSRGSSKRAKNSATSSTSTKSISGSASKIKSASNQKGNSSSSESIHTEVSSTVSTSSDGNVRSKGKKSRKS